MQMYLFRIVCGAVISSILQSLPLRGSIRRLVMLSCGCLMVLLTLTPLLHLDFAALTVKLPEIFSSQMPELSPKNDELLQQLICEQTEETITNKAQSYGILCTASVTLQYDSEIGSYLPYSVRLNVSQSSGTLDAFRNFITQELAIPEERQTWVLN